MNKLFSFFLVTFLSLNAWAGRIVTDSISSKVLGTTVKYNVYLPDGFDKSTQKYPFVYLLHGLTGVYSDWAERGQMREITDELIGTGEAAPMVIIMPNAGHPDTRNHWNGYFNMPGWNYETFFFTELLPTVEKKYRAIGDKTHRAVMGLSMGGGGSTVYCQRYPELFSSCYSMSGWLNNEEPKEGPGGKDKRYLVSKSVRDHAATNFIAHADQATIAKLRTVRWFFDCGDDDYLVKLSFQMHELSAKAGIKSELRIRNGVHNWEYWRGCLRTALPFASIDFRR